MQYLRRAIDARLDFLMRHIPAIAIDGPKGVGKTETAAQRSAIVFHLDRPEQRSILEADLGLTAVPKGAVLLDEWQRLPAVWDSVRRAVDGGAKPGRFLLTGSATPHDAAGTHSGAGRILSLRLRPMALFERGDVNADVSFADILHGEVELPFRGTDFALRDYVHAICASGFPGIMRNDAQIAEELLDSYLLRVIDRDLPDYGVSVRRPETLRRWMAAYAAASSTTTQYSKILDATTGGDGTQPAQSTTIAYRNHLSALWLLDPVPGWIPANNPLKRLTLAPKHQLADPALAVRLLGLNQRSLISGRGQHMLGQLFESLATLSVRAAAEALRAKVYHLRTKNGDHEIDLIVEGCDGELLAIEVKLAQAISDQDVKHLLWLRAKLQRSELQLLVLNTGTQAYRRADGIIVVPLAMLGL